MLFRLVHLDRQRTDEHHHVAWRRPARLPSRRPVPSGRQLVASVLAAQRIRHVRRLYVRPEHAEHRVSARPVPVAELPRQDRLSAGQEGVLQAVPGCERAMNGRVAITPPNRRMSCVIPCSFSFVSPKQVKPSHRHSRPHSASMGATAMTSMTLPSTASAMQAGNGLNAVDREVQQDEARPKTITVATRTNEDILANGGCSVAQVIYDNGQEWHPVLPTGEQKCVTCRCKVSVVEDRSTRIVLNSLCVCRIPISNAYANDALDRCATIASHCIMGNIRRDRAARRPAAIIITAATTATLWMVAAFWTNAVRRIAADRDATRTRSVRCARMPNGTGTLNVTVGVEFEACR